MHIHNAYTLLIGNSFILNKYLSPFIQHATSDSLILHFFSSVFLNPEFCFIYQSEWVYVYPWWRGLISGHGPCHQPTRNTFPQSNASIVRRPDAHAGGGLLIAPGLDDVWSCGDESNQNLPFAGGKALWAVCVGVGLAGLLTLRTPESAVLVKMF